jgi:hypothetical protein
MKKTVKAVMKEIKEQLYKWIDIPYSWTGKQYH